MGWCPLRRSLGLFLPVSGAISLVLLPMQALYEQTRLEAVEGRDGGLVQAALLRVETTLHEPRERRRGAFCAGASGSAATSVDLGVVSAVAGPGVS